MGCDGGTIPKRHELVKGPKKVEKVKFTCIFLSYDFFLSTLTIRLLAVSQHTRKRQCM